MGKQPRAPRRRTARGTPHRREVMQPMPVCSSSCEVEYSTGQDDAPSLL